MLIDDLDIQTEQPVNNRNLSILILALVEFFDRFCYYGIRGIAVLYLVDEAGFGFTRELAFDYYGNFTLLMGILPIVAGLLTDLFFKQKKGVLFGIVTTLLATVMMTLSAGNFNLVIVGMILLAIGGSLIKVNNIVLVGRLYDKNNSNRPKAFIWILLSINIGAFLSILLVGRVGELYGWQFGFGLTAIAALINLILFYINKDKLSLIEKPIEQNDEDILKTIPQRRLSSWTLIISLSFLATIFWAGYKKFDARLSDSLSNIESIEVLGYNFSSFVIFNSLPSVVTLLTLVGLLIYWSNRKLGGAIKNLSIAFLMLVGIGVFTVALQYVDMDALFVTALSVMFLFGITENIFSPYMMSYITRVSSMKWASTQYSLYLLISSSTSFVFYWTADVLGASDIYLYIILPVLASALLWLNKDKILMWTRGID